MALHMNLMVNDVRIGWLHARRLTPPGSPGPDDVCTYEWHVRQHGRNVVSVEPLEHRYGDGAWALVARIVDAAGLSDASGPGDRPAS